MEESVRWVSKPAAAAELEISRSTLERMIRRGELEVAREGRRVYVRMHGPEHPSDGELLRPPGAGQEESQQTVREMEQSLSEWQLRVSELERERDEARESAATASQPYLELERDYQKEVAAHRGTSQTVTAARAASILLLVLLIGLVLLWWFVLRQ